MTTITAYLIASNGTENTLRNPIASWVLVDKHDDFLAQAEYDDNDTVKDAVARLQASGDLPKGSVVSVRREPFSDSWVHEDHPHRYTVEIDTEATEEEAAQSEKRGRGRPSIGTVVTVRLGQEHIAGLDTLAAKHGTTRAEEIRQAVADRLTAHGVEDLKTIAEALPTTGRISTMSKAAVKRGDYYVVLRGRTPMLGLYVDPNSPEDGGRSLSLRDRMELAASAEETLSEAGMTLAAPKGDVVECLAEWGEVRVSLPETR